MGRSTHPAKRYCSTICLLKAAAWTGGRVRKGGGLQVPCCAVQTIGGQHRPRVHCGATSAVLCAQAWMSQTPVTHNSTHLTGGLLPVLRCAVAPPQAVRLVHRSHLVVCGRLCRYGRRRGSSLTRGDGTYVQYAAASTRGAAPACESIHCTSMPLQTKCYRNGLSCSWQSRIGGPVYARVLTQLYSTLIGFTLLAAGVGMSGMSAAAPSTPLAIMTSHNRTLVSLVTEAGGTEGPKLWTMHLVAGRAGFACLASTSACPANPGAAGVLCTQHASAACDQP